MVERSRLTAGLVLSGAALLLLNIAFGAFYILWSIADTEATNRMEDVAGFDRALLLPNAEIMWVAAQASLVLLLVVDVMYVLQLLGRKRRAVPIADS